MPSVEVPETHIPRVVPRAYVDVEVQVTSTELPERPPSLSPRTAGWPPIAATLTLAWNDIGGWAPRTDDPDPFGADEYFGFTRQHYSTLSLPPNQLPKDYRWPADRSMSVAKGEALTQLVQFERVLDIWLSTSEELLEAVNTWESDIERGRSVFSRDPVVSARANSEMRQDLDRLTLTTFVSMTILHDHAAKMLGYCDVDARQGVTNMKALLHRRFPSARHAGTVRNYLVHHQLLNWICSHTYGESTLTIGVDLKPILRWASTRDQKRTEVENVMFAEFLQQYGASGRADTVPLRTWMDELVGANRDPMLALYRNASIAIAQMR